MVRSERVKLPRIGAAKLHFKLAPKLDAMGVSMGRDSFATLLSENNLLVRRKRSSRKTTFSQHRYFKYPNIIRNFTPTAPNQLWVSDITYISVGYGFIYLSLITDAFSRKIVGWNLSRDLGAANALKALKSALKELPKDAMLIHHSDRGVQYCCDAYVAELTKRNVAISMTENGDPLENAIAERVNGILKTEWIYEQRFESFGQAKEYVSRIVNLYNSERPHQSIGYMTPESVHSGTTEGLEPPPRLWKNYYKPRCDFAPSGEFSSFEVASSQGAV